MSSHGLLTRIPIVTQSRIPLSVHATENQFKLYYFDTGLLLRQMNIPAQIILSQQIDDYRGFILENFVAQELSAHFNSRLYCWKGATSEVEFLMQTNSGIVPVEVKSSQRSRRSKSLQAYLQKYQPQQACKITTQNSGQNATLTTLPLYAIHRLPEILREE